MNPSLSAPGPGRPKDPAKREAILAAAQVLFLGNGYEGSSMDAIAAEAGVSKLTLYSHFGDKEALFCAAVKATCETRLPRRLFQLDDEASIEQVLLDITRAFHALVNSPESIGLHRVMVTMATQNPALVRSFFDAGPQQLLLDLQQLFGQASARGLLRIPEPLRAAEHFCSLIKGVQHFRLLIGYSDTPDESAAEAHVQDVVALFMRAYQR
ncbi:TetR/AcrR family transcriptional regulator [Stutzerimonas nitrititolerans]|uniref:TetR/AcrR family transcriptional regulator n=1 Tax=Stutzerimonas nitrititolerans TaxID=2482751 RepID=UPI00289D3E76|nr:TetR/AcrR family transcriptional regulator [Stutzerimonas nitrititolerans]